MAEKDCGCRTMVQITNDYEGFTHSSRITYCPMHEAASVMLRALKRLVRRLDNGDTISREWFGWDAARHAIRKAEEGGSQ